ncbi:MAG: mechanosensitive ion channel family protein [Rhizobiales bacterium]|nr:mechanosensitive ion channel family protein [Hyphomicrobiales bacterium]MBI3672925.1 mechanosensitive ion channel family protein [Hyphomicrobiales bacterium]
MARRVRLMLAILAASWLLTAAAQAYNEAIVSKAEQAVSSLTLDLRTLDAGVNSAGVSDEQLQLFRNQVEDIRTKATATVATLADPIAEITQQITKLGPAPAEGTSEPESVAAQRKLLNDELSRLVGPKSQLDLIVVGAEQLSGRISAIQRDQFVKRIFQGGRSVFNPYLWVETAKGLALLNTRLIGLFSEWLSGAGHLANIIGLVVIPAYLIIFLGALVLLRRSLRRRFLAYSDSGLAPNDIARLWRLARVVTSVFAGLAALVLPVYAALDAASLMTPRLALVVNPLIDVVFMTAVYWTLARRLAAPGQPRWRLVDLDAVAAARFPLLVGLTALVVAMARALGTVADGLFLPVSYTVGQSAVSAAIILLLLALTLYSLRHQQGLAEKSPGRRLYFGWARRFVPALWLAIAVGVGALLAGYVALASYIAEQIFETAVLIAVLFLLHHLSDAAVNSSIDPQSGLGRTLRRVTGLGERGVERLGIVFRTAADIVLLLAGLPLLLALWTLTWVDFRSLANTAFSGFRIGDVTVSPSTMLLVILVLAGGIVATNLMVRWLDRRILAQTRVDKGVQDSLKKGASYAGYILALGMAFSAAGLNFSTIAIVAGALGVGIGFGLQSIVNNFVSGLILLIERPIRVGDWVVLDVGEGLVKRINVRSTEIETFDSCSIIVPNSSLVTGVVRNWTHGDNFGRFTVAVSVEYGSDAAKVRDLLLDCARSHPKVLTFPEPQALLVRFGAYGLDFEIKAAVADIFEGAIVANDLRHAILKTFGEKTISIARPLALIQPTKN